ncbi:non-hydrolyzing UDP-N-acetylglucosamine 2-epimerase [Polluticoccus soli]|uniref:non-hydrolyzing UDP-N-acetylglucosamine 2-epimerase n=1 Tax=Polluticoccus soli TaxID=3034150 RepID=UPI0023E2667A|nr:UDP-N-acetylglucosamine 2-epimerase (non-hydrolyzing) [Flavipsychrobacter sp. JY13-12]
MLIDLIAGARPNFIKVASIIEAIERAQNEGLPVKYRLIHTGQHYDGNMSGSFFEELNIPAPYYNLQVGGGSQAEQTARIMVAYERILLDEPCDVCLVVGDVNSTMACAIAAKKIPGIKLAHVEAGIRSGDMTMPEEINRIVTDSITDYFFTTSETASENLRKTGVDKSSIFFVGNTMIDTLLKNDSRLKKPQLWEGLKLENGQYIVLTLHRPNNVDDPAKLTQLLDTVATSAQGMKVIFPVHPRTAKIIEEHQLIASGIYTITPLSYLEFNYLVKYAKGVVTDSGGITEEATVMGVPCMTLRDSTERPETCTIGTNELLGTDPQNIPPAFARLFAGSWKKGGIPDKWDGKSADRIVSTLLAIYTDGKAIV